MLLKKLLVDSKAISSKDFQEAEKEAEEKKSPLDDVLIEKNLISDEELGRLLADELGFPFINLRKTKIKPEILEIVPEILAKEKGIIVFDKDKKGLKAALSEPGNLETIEFLGKKTGQNIIPHFATKRDIVSALNYYQKDLKEQVEKLLAKAAVNQPPVAELVQLILELANFNRASDIHFEPYSDKTVLRFRIDGVLHDVLVLPKSFHDLLISRIKVLSRLRTDLHDSSQDGHFSFEGPQEQIDIRVSVVPVEQDEKAVLRLLSEKTRKLDLKDLGFSEKDLKIVQKQIKKPWGMILVSGPAGSGKTTTLYAILKILNKRSVNIMTIEDPIEYDIDGINQIQVNQKTNLTFAEGLKAIVRQNPDIIMVGEIRDDETVSLAVNAAMTGHLVLSTFHANDAATSLTRLADMGAEPYLITSTVNLVISQRLVRRICPQCIESYEIEASKIPFKLQKSATGKIRLFRGRGCSLCQDTGYLGRVAIFEILEMQESIKSLVIGKADAGQIKAEAQKLGMATMLEDGWKKAENGVTTLEEILRVTKSD